VKSTSTSHPVAYSTKLVTKLTLVKTAAPAAVFYANIILMNITETIENIIKSDEFVLSETKKIQYGYGLKRVIRYIVERNEEIATESVAEHVYALHLLADYFLPLEDQNHTMDWTKVHDMLQYHDIDEIETGDIIGYLKTDADREAEETAAEKVLASFPAHLQPKVHAINEEYNAQQSPEAKFAKALDRIEPVFQIYNDNGKKIMHLQKTTKEQAHHHKAPYVSDYPCLKRFFEVIEATMDKEGFYQPE